MKITFLTPQIEPSRFAGGIYCILKYAQGLHERGHEVTIIGYPGSQPPKWTKFQGKLIFPEVPRIKITKSKRRMLKSVSNYLDYKLLHTKPDIVRRSLVQTAVGEVIPESDATIATFWETADIAYRFGSGTRAYFMQHFEPYFYSPSSPDYYEAMKSYSLPLLQIANSSWLKQKVLAHGKLLGLDRQTVLCTNAVDLENYYVDPGVPKLTTKNNEVNIISYGGRGVAWKGFREMAEAVSIVRRELQQYTINWNVYGDSELPPDNTIASYNALGFLDPQKLNTAYNANDILLSASWYESFPLFPIEAMACGLAVITTEKGTEDYARNQENCLVVEEKNPRAIASALQHLITSKDLRAKLQVQARSTAQAFSWEHSVDRMEAILKKRIASA